MIDHPRIAIYSTLLNRLVTATDSIEFMTFPGGEPHVKLSPVAVQRIRREEAIVIDCRPQSFLDLGYLILLVHTLASVASHTALHLLMPYVPGARQDRDDPFTAGIITSMINDLWLESVRIYDPHSLVIVEHLENVVVSEPDLHPDMHSTYVAIVAPDEGSHARSARMAERIGLTADDIVYCSKKRDSVTGELSGFQLDTRNLPVGHYLLFDDICDGGGTFIGVYDTIAERYGELYDELPDIDLFVTHGIFSKGTDQLLSKFDTIYSTTSWLSHDALTAKAVKPILIHEREILR